MKAQMWVLPAAGVFTLFAAGAAVADDTRDQSVFVFGQGGGISSADHFDTFRDANFKTGYNLGGGVGVQLNRYLAVRGNFFFARSRGQDLDSDVPAFGNTMFDRYIYSGDLQLGYPVGGGVTPYVVAGGGAMTFSNRTDLTMANFTRGFGKGGVGVNVDIPRTRVGLFVQGTGLLYKLPSFDPNRTLFDISWTGGVRIRI